MESDLASQREESRQWKVRAEELQRNVENRSRDLEKKGTQIMELDQAFHKLKVRISHTTMALEHTVDSA